VTTDSAEIVIALNEIAALLKRRVEQVDAADQRGAERFAAVQARVPAERPDFLKVMHENAERAARSFEEIETARAASRAFQEKLLAALDRQNALLERLLARAEA
jgi:propanediol dehydratase large subunit